MTFNFKDFGTFTYKALFKSKGTNYRLVPRRIGWLVLFYALYPLWELAIWLGFLMDEIFFSGYRQEEIEEPVFIVGNPRSGTTFLQRLLARDDQTFDSMRTWEMFFAPSVTVRKIVRCISALDRRLGSPLHRALGMLEESWQEDNVMHRVALRAPEEDEYLLLHIWSNLKIWLFAGMLEEAAPYTYFDTAMPDEEKKRILDFYKGCLQRHLHAHGIENRHYLAKNPHYTPMIDTLYSYFPDAKIIYLARNPLDMIPSYVNMKDFEWKVTGDPVEDYACRDYILDMAQHWYTYPLERLEQAPLDSYIVINFNDLVGNAGRTVREIYDWFGFELTPAFARVLRTATERARDHESDHEYSLQEMGLTREEIVEKYKTVFERFGFDTRDGRGEPEEERQEEAGSVGRRQSDARGDESALGLSR